MQHQTEPTSDKLYPSIGVVFLLLLSGVSCDNSRQARIMLMHLPNMSQVSATFIEFLSGTNAVFSLFFFCAVSDSFSRIRPVANGRQ